MSEEEVHRRDAENAEMRKDKDQPQIAQIAADCKHA